MSVRANSTARVSAKFTGIPKPDVKWSKVDGTILEKTENVSITTDNNSTSLTLKNAQRSDSGDYTVTVQNEAGIKAASAHINVLGMLFNSFLDIAILSLKTVQVHVALYLA